MESPTTSRSRDIQMLFLGAIIVILIQLIVYFASQGPPSASPLEQREKDLLRKLSALHMSEELAETRNKLAATTLELIATKRNQQDAKHLGFESYGYEEQSQAQAEYEKKLLKSLKKGEFRVGSWGRKIWGTQ